jgi:hypothetical protein
MKVLTDTLSETELWLEDEHSKEEYDNKMTEVNSILNPIMMKVYSEGADGTGMPSAVPQDMPSTEGTESASMPSIDEID